MNTRIRGMLATIDFKDRVDRLVLADAMDDEARQEEATLLRSEHPVVPRSGVCVWAEVAVQPVAVPEGNAATCPWCDRRVGLLMSRDSDPGVAVVYQGDPCEHVLCWRESQEYPPSGTDHGGPLPWYYERCRLEDDYYHPHIAEIDPAKDMRDYWGDLLDDAVLRVVAPQNVAIADYRTEEGETAPDFHPWFRIQGRVVFCEHPVDLVTAFLRHNLETRELIRIAEKEARAAAWAAEIEKLVSSARVGGRINNNAHARWALGPGQDRLRKRGLEAWQLFQFRVFLPVHPSIPALVARITSRLDRAAVDELRDVLAGQVGSGFFDEVASEIGRRRLRSDRRRERKSASGAAGQA
jgi:hypothetical protein